MSTVIPSVLLGTACTVVAIGVWYVTVGRERIIRAAAARIERETIRQLELRIHAGPELAAQLANDANVRGAATDILRQALP